MLVTGEEKGCSDRSYFAAHPTVSAKTMVADLNEDMFLPLVTLKVLTVYGLAESDLGDRAAEAAAKYGVKVQPDPAPLFNAFIRSDQYNFIRHGVPSLAMGFGGVIRRSRKHFESGSQIAITRRAMTWHNQSIKALPGSSRTFIARWPWR